MSCLPAAKMFSWQSARLQPEGNCWTSSAASGIVLWLLVAAVAAAAAVAVGAGPQPDGRGSSKVRLLASPAPCLIIVATAAMLVAAGGGFPCLTALCRVPAAAKSDALAFPASIVGVRVASTTVADLSLGRLCVSGAHLLLH